MTLSKLFGNVQGVHTNMSHLPPDYKKFERVGYISQNPELLRENHQQGFISPNEQSIVYEISYMQQDFPVREARVILKNGKMIQITPLGWIVIHEPDILAGKGPRPPNSEEIKAALREIRAYGERSWIMCDPYCSNHSSREIDITRELEKMIIRYLAQTEI